jgi:hypothetical protein
MGRGLSLSLGLGLFLGLRAGGGTSAGALIAFRSQWLGSLETTGREGRREQGAGGREKGAGRREKGAGVWRARERQGDAGKGRERRSRCEYACEYGCE